MKELVDLYAKLVIGTFSFIGPYFTLLISLFFKALKKSTEKHKAQIANLNNLIKANLSAGDISQAKLLAILRAWMKERSQNEKDLNLLNPKRQVKRLFISLLSAIFFIELYYFQHSHLCPFNDQTIRIVTIALSGISFSYTLMVLWQLFCTIIRIKTEEEENNLSNNVPLKAKKSSK